MVCEVLDINRSSYYAHRDRRRQVDVERLELRAKVKQVFTKSRRSAGSRTIKTKLNEDGIQIGRFKVRRLMALASLIRARNRATASGPDLQIASLASSSN